MHFEPGAYDAYTVDGGGIPVPYDAPVGVDDGYNLQVTASTPVFQLIDASVSVVHGRQPIFDEGSTGMVTSLTGSINLRPLTPLRIQGLLAYQRLTRVRDGSEFARTIIPRLKVEYQILRPLFLRLVGEYRSQRRAELRSAEEGLPLLIDGAPAPAQETNQVRLDALLSFQPSPGTVAFLGYGTGLNDETAFGFSNFARQNDGFFVKFAYQFRW